VQRYIIVTFIMTTVQFHNDIIYYSRVLRYYYIVIIRFASIGMPSGRARVTGIFGILGPSRQSVRMRAYMTGWPITLQHII